MASLNFSEEFMNKKETIIGHPANVTVRDTLFNGFPLLSDFYPVIFFGIVRCRKH